LKNILFICSKNKWRSLTAETIFKNHPHCNVKSAGTEEGARVKVNAKLIQWADHILVMERKHKEKMQLKFPEEITEKEIIVLDIPDEYKYMDKELIEELESALVEVLDY
jgi:predicted protein tyrosine phosphatase